VGESLSEDKLSKIKEFSRMFKDYMQTDDYREDENERRKRKPLFEPLYKDKIDDLTELDFKSIILSLWATGFFGNRDYVVNRIMQENSFEKIKKELKALLWGSDPLEKRYDKFNVKGLGPASVTEILTFIFPDSCGIWNDKARKALRILGFSENEIPLNKYHIKAKEYIKFNNHLKLISQELEKNLNLKDIDLIEVDFFLYTVFLNQARVITTKPPYEWDHFEIRDKVYEIGNSLGFEAEKEKLIARGAQVDVVWRAKIANLGAVTYVFEVHKSGDPDKDILNLQRAKVNPTVQRLVIVSDEPGIKKFKKEVANLHEDFRNALTYFDVKDVEEMYDSLEVIGRVLSKLDLVKPDFEIQETQS